MLKREVEDELDKTIDLFYQQKTKEANEALIAVLPKLTKISEEYIQQGDRSVLQALQMVVEAMEKKDNTLMADILQYEFLDKIKERK